MSVVSTERRGAREVAPLPRSRRWTSSVMVLLSFAVLMILWHIGATFWPSRSFPAPLLVLQKFTSETASGDLPYHLAITLWRVAASFFLAMIDQIGPGPVLPKALQRKPYCSVSDVSEVTVGCLMVFCMMGRKPFTMTATPWVVGCMPSACSSEAFVAIPSMKNG